MVTNTTMPTIHSKNDNNEANFSRWFRQSFYMPWLASRRFDRTARAVIEEAVSNAEVGHAGEIRVVIEGHLPLGTALYQGTTGRARDLFASLRVWDTAMNSGILLYINLCEHRVEIVADRGVNAKIEPSRWQTICQAVTTKLSAEEYQQGVVLGIEMIGVTLTEYYKVLESEAGNELSNAAIFL
ncbi:MAG: TPM domain-containing protein [Aquirhabdus sp.]